MLTRKQAKLDVLVVGGCSSAYVVASLLQIPIGWIIPVVFVVLTSYFVFVLRRRSQTWHDYGLRKDNVAAAAWRVGCWTLVAAGVIVAWAIARGDSLLRPELLILLPLYPLWGLVQQFIFQAILHQGLLALVPIRPIALLLNSFAFAAVHVSDWRVVGLTFIAGICWSWFYQRWPNIWVLGLSHGVLAGLTYPLLLADNPLERFF